MSANKPMQIGARLRGQQSAGPGQDSGLDARSRPNDVPSLLELGSDLYQAGRLSEAEWVLRHILQIQFDQFESLQLLAVISSQQGKHAQALDYIDTALRTNADSSAAHNIRGNVLATQKRLEEAAASFKAAIALEPDSPISLTNLGNTLHELKRFGDAIAVYDRALAIDPDDAEACYNRACALQELQRRLGGAYVQAVRRLAPQAERITDKMPFNFAHAGFIHLVLPNARIIHVRRDPRDTALSCFSLRFTNGQEFTYDLAELGRYYRAYQSVMEHWRRALPEGVMLEVQYEDVVADLEGQARRIVAHCGLDWDEACLAFHETERPVRTASVTQVRQPIYQSSVGRWRAYESLLQPFLEALGES